jgi:hypothetical protein
MAQLTVSCCVVEPAARDLLPVPFGKRDGRADRRVLCMRSERQVCHLTNHYTELRIMCYPRARVPPRQLYLSCCHADGNRIAQALEHAEFDHV